LETYSLRISPLARLFLFFGGMGHTMEKLISAQEAVSRIQDGDRIMVGGFGMVGCPLMLVRAVAESQVRNLTVISNNLGEPGKGLDVLVSRKKVTVAIGSFFTSNPGVVEAHLQGELEIELIPQGTFAEAIRAGGAGIGGFCTPAGVGTKLEEGKQLKVIRDKRYLF
jgi:3-oxoacid CoA-transferase subunit A